MKSRFLKFSPAVFVPLVSGAYADEGAFAAQLDRAGYPAGRKECVLAELREGGEAVDYGSLAEGLQAQLDLAEAEGAPVDDAAREEIIMGLAEALPFFAARSFGVGDPDAVKTLSSVSAALLLKCAPSPG